MNFNIMNSISDNVIIKLGNYEEVIQYNINGSKNIEYAKESDFFIYSNSFQGLIISDLISSRFNLSVWLVYII